MSGKIKHLTFDSTTPVGSLVTVLCGRSVARRDPELIEGYRECKRCRAKVDKRPKWAPVVYSVSMWPPATSTSNPAVLKPIRTSSTEREL